MHLCEMQQRMSCALLKPLQTKMLDTDYDFISSTPILNAAQRLDIYRDSYWYRLIHAFEEDFPGVQAILGTSAFETLSRAYLADFPSRSFTLRNLGQFLEQWLEKNPTFAPDDYDLCLDMIRLEWAEIECFDALEKPALTVAELATAGADSQFGIQPYVQLLTLAHPVDDLRIAAKNASGSDDRTCIEEALYASRNHDGAPIYLAVHRQDFDIYYRTLGKEEMVMLISLKSGSTLEAAIATAFNESVLAPEDQAKMITECFSNWSQMGWMCHAEVSVEDN